MPKKICIDCKEDKDIKLFGVQYKYVSTKGKGTTIHLYPCCKGCQYKRTKKSLAKRDEAKILKDKEYQKAYYKEWAKENRTGTDWYKKYKKLKKQKPKK